MPSEKFGSDLDAEPLRLGRVLASGTRGSLRAARRGELQEPLQADASRIDYRSCESSQINKWTCLDIVRVCLLSLSLCRITHLSVAHYHGR